MRFQPPKGDHKMITGKKCPKSYFIANIVKGCIDMKVNTN